MNPKEYLSTACLMVSLWFGLCVAGYSEPAEGNRNTSDESAVRNKVIEQILETVRIISIEVEESTMEDACSLLESKINKILVEQGVHLRVRIVVEYGGQNQVDFRLRNNLAKTVLEVMTDQAGLAYRIIDGKIIVRSFVEQ